MDEAGMTAADRVGLVEDALLIWGEDAAHELADRYNVTLERQGDKLLPCADEA
jgi:hypothetical protein